MDRYPQESLNLDWKNKKLSLVYDMYISFKKTFHNTPKTSDVSHLMNLKKQDQYTFSKFAWSESLKKKDAKNVTKSFEEIIKRAMIKEQTL
ncbi:Hypothetical protein CINCED_3A022034 [Cinara cedri]|uniref:Uncharacterized protein n=1 Tax=Cinara cedri TaxID=506608 RepID=A0A5E4NQK0_9HEMI|nr:Hypothetical protein CINCED_3A022034 [Cinara cedri]